jgi:hypothetical protein
MYKGTIMITNKGLGVKTNKFHEFWWICIFVGFIQKTVKVDLHVRVNHAYPPRNGHQKFPKNSRGHQTKVGVKGLPHVGHPTPRATCQPPPRYVGSPPPPRLHLHYSLSQFDPMAHDGHSGLYKQPCTLLPQ